MSDGNLINFHDHITILLKRDDIYNLPIFSRKEISYFRTQIETQCNFKISDFLLQKVLDKT